MNLFLFSFTDIPTKPPKKKKKKDKKERDGDEKGQNFLEALGVLELEEVDFCMLTPGMSRDEAEKKGWTFTAPVKLTDAFLDLSSFKRYLRQQHLDSRMSVKGTKDFEVELRVIKNGKKELMAGSPAEFDSLRQKLVTRSDKYTLLGKYSYQYIYQFCKLICYLVLLLLIR